MNETDIIDSRLDCDEWSDPVFICGNAAEAAELLIDELYDQFRDERYLPVLEAAQTAIRTMREWRGFAKSAGAAVDKLITPIRLKFKSEEYDLIVAKAALALSKMEELTYKQRRG